MTEDHLIFLVILFAVTGAFFWLVAVPSALLLAGVRAVLRAVRRRRERAREDAQFALSRAELNDALVEQAAKEAISEGLVKLFNALGPPPYDASGEDR